MSAPVAIVDYGIGNIQSVVDAFVRAGARPVTCTSGEQLRPLSPAAIVLPGVGAAGEALQRLRARGLEAALAEAVLERATPFLGICVGMQMLGEVCEEFGEHRGLGWIGGRVRRLAPEGSGVRLPHVGWNNLEVVRPDDALLGPLDGQDMYFVHSYALQAAPVDTVAVVEYGEVRFAAAVRREHIVGVQFHPEKSSRAGALLIGGFLRAAGMPAALAHA